jgi:DNA glycosylase AlkZ-like
LPVPAQQISQRALNRATLARQMLLDRRVCEPLQAIEHLVGLQAQAPTPPYFGLWSRVAGFQPDDLSKLIMDRQVVRLALMRSTVHLCSAEDALFLRPALADYLVRTLRSSAHGKATSGVDGAALARHGRALVEEQPLTSRQLGDALAEQFPDVSPTALANSVRNLIPLVQVPPRGLWGRSGQPTVTTLESWLGRSMESAPSLEKLITRYLAAFGPASVADVQAWCGLTRLGDVVARMDLVEFTSASGSRLFDLPEAPRPGPDIPAPVRFIADFDNLTIGYADRSRVLSETDRRRVYPANGLIPGMVLVDGAVVAVWRLSTSKGTAKLRVGTLSKVSKDDASAILDEGAMLLNFAAPDAGHDIVIVPYDAISTETVAR